MKALHRRNPASRSVWRGALPLAAFLLAGTVSPAPGAAEDTGALEELAPHVFTAKLPEGPTLLLIPQRSVPMFASTVLVPSGSALEDRATSGAAHYLEHLLFNGTTTLTREELYALTDRLGAYNNASTQRDRTVFQLLLPSENWREGLELQAGMLLHSTLPREMFEKEKGILLEELAKDMSDAGWEADRHDARALWGDSSRGLPVLGREDSIRDMDPAAIDRFYREQYRSASMTVVLMGDFDPRTARDTVAKLWGTSEPAPALPLRPALAAEHRWSSLAIDALGSVRLRLHVPLPAFGPEDHAAARLLEQLLNGGETTALSRAAGEAGFEVRSAFASIDPGEPWSLLTLGADLSADAWPPADDSAALLAETLLGRVRAFASSPPGSGEWASAWQELRVDEIFLREKMHYYGLMRADLVGGAGPAVAVRWLDDPASATRRCLELAHAAASSDRSVLTVAGPGLTTGTGTWTPDVPDGTVGWAPVFTELTRDGEEAYSPVDGSGRSREILDNGLTLITRSSPESRTFATHVLFRERGALEARLGLPRGSSDVVHRLMQQGTKSHTEDELRGRLSSLAIRLKVTDSAWIPYDDYYFSPEFSYVRLETASDFGPEALELLHEVVHEPTFDEAAVRKAIDGARSRAERQHGSARETAYATLFARGWSDHPRAYGVFEDPAALELLQADDLRRLHAAMTAPENLAVVVVSDRPREEIDEFAQRHLADRSGSGSPVEAPPCRPNPPIREEVDLGQEQAWIVLGIPLEILPGNDDRQAIRLAAAVLSDRLADQLREREGLAYSIGASVRVDGPGPALLLSAGTRHENLERMEAGLREITAALATDPPTADELVAARNGSEGRTRMRQLSRMGQAYALAMKELRREPVFTTYAKMEVADPVTPEDVATAAERHFRPARAHVVVVR